ncbi:hypothetical protein [Stratiformator vulcanicus]|uniref:Uncharacterized protein n=1 Tax=Stratiformator vulcanicus TaxID=2527980 RepID=A0A517QYW7_9PLAN|nr:hypothetical protein [Stratiformator vulcanicus]QDT36798.1 hypothetical protein Pan189_11610 [Stratiformator vulcanicus]
MALAGGAGLLQLVLTMLLGGGLAGGGIAGMPPGERDPNLIKAASTECLIYCEWVARGAGEPGGPGVVGFAADPEVKDFMEKLTSAVTSRLREEASREGPEQQIVAEQLPQLLIDLSARPGCILLNYAPRNVGGADAEPLDEAAAPWAAYLRGLEATLIIDGGEKSDEIADRIGKLLDVPPGLEKTDDLKMQSLPIPVPGLKMTLHRDENYFVLAVGRESLIETALSGIAGDGNGLAEDDRFAKAFEATEVKKLSSLLWLDSARLLEVGSTSFGMYGGVANGVARTLALDRLDSIATCVGVEEGQIVTRTELRVMDGDRVGIWALAAGEAIQADDFKTVPGDADFVAAVSINAKEILTQTRTIIAQTSPNSVEVLDRRIEQFETMLGHSLEEDVLTSFGQKVIIHNAPSTGGVFISSPIAMVEVTKPEQAFGIFSKSMSLLDDWLPGETREPPRRRGVFLAKQKFLGKTIYYVNFVGEDEVPFAPSFCFTGKHVVAAPHPQPIKAYLRYVDSPSDEQESFADVVQEMVSGSEGEVIAYNRLDANKAVDLLYAVVPYVAQIVMSEGQKRGLEMTVFDVPSAAAIRPYVFPATSLTTRTDRGYVVESRAALPVPGLQVAPAALAVPFFAVQRSASRARAMREFNLQRQERLLEKAEEAAEEAADEAAE